MADDDAGTQASSGPGPGPPPQVLAGNRMSGAAAPPTDKEPGWYPVRTNPNEQTYWDGNDWTGRRRWSAGTGWTEVGGDQLGAVAVPGLVAPGPPGPRLSANPYAPHPTATAPAARPAPGVTLGLMLLIFSAIAMMAGSVTTWISSSSSAGGNVIPGGINQVGRSISAATSGVDAGVSGLIGINGYITLIAAAVVLVFAGLMAVSDDFSVRLVGCAFAVISLGLSIFAVVRLVQKINDAHPLHGVSVNIGWGAILMLAAAVVATLITLYEVTKSR